MNWVNIASSGMKPPIGRAVICYCRDWCGLGYQIATWNGKEFEYIEQPNDMFDLTVTDWAIFMEAD